jgi:hypothetical protein
MKSKDCVKCEMDNLQRIRDKREQQMKGLAGRFMCVYHNSLTGGNSDCVKAMCHECIGWHDVKDSIMDCRGWGCPLYFRRPFQFDDTRQVLEILSKEEKELPEIKKYIDQGKKNTAGLEAYRSGNGQTQG